MSSSTEQVGVGLYLVPLEQKRGFHIKGESPCLPVSPRCFLCFPQALSPAALQNALVKCAWMTC